MRIAAVAMAALLPASLLAQPAVAAPLTPNRYAFQAFQLTNDFRSGSQIPRLAKSACLQQFAASHAQRMASKRRLYHQKLDPIFDTCGLSMVGENVSAGYRTGKATVRGWMRSKFHRANILNRQYRLMAVAARKGGDNQWYVVQIFGRLL